MSRSDILFAASRVSRFLNNPGLEHWAAVRRILKHLQSTMDIIIMYKAGDIQLVVYSDADFVGDCDTHRSTTGYLSLLANGPVTWFTHRQKCVMKSTTEAEFILRPRMQQLK